MIHLLAKFEELEWNRRAFTDETFERLCRKHRIKVFDIPLRVPGFYMACKGKRCIYLNDKVRGVQRLYNGLHELGHYFLHALKEPTAALFLGLQPGTREEIEADIFAVVALIPEPLLRRMLGTPEEEWQHGFTAEMLELRLRVLEKYGV